MIDVEKTLMDWQKENYSHAYAMMKEAIDSVREEHDIVKQKYCAEHFNVSVNTLKEWVQLGCPEIRLKSGMVLYSKHTVREWLLKHQ